jgi:hypothetical protein
MEIRRGNITVDNVKEGLNGAKYDQAQIRQTVFKQYDAVNPSSNLQDS